MARCLLLALAIAGVARADGKVFSQAVPVVDIPDQRALLWFRGGRERLVIETTYAKETRSDGFAWVVPLPSVPTIEAFSPDAFRTAEIVFAPPFQAEQDEGWRPALYFLALALALGLLATRTRSGAARLAVVVGGMLAGLFLLLLALNTPLAAGAAAGGVEVLGRSRIGAYDVATLRALDSAALRAWLEENGFRVAPESAAAIDAYAGEGWVFAAGRLELDRHGKRRRPHPVSFEFAAEKPVYPLRLTGAGNGDCRIDLYVFGDRRARSARLPATYCVQIYESDAPPDYAAYSPHGRRILIAHEDLRRVARGARVLTKLSGTLASGEMREDLVIEWEDYAFLGDTVYTRAAARDRAASAGLWTALLSLIPLLLAAAVHAAHASVRARTGRRPTWREIRREDVRFGRRRLLAVWVGALAVGTCVGVAVYRSLETTDARVLTGADEWSQRQLHEALARQIAEAGVWDVARARGMAELVWQDRTNPYTGRPVEEAATPGNYRIRSEEGRAVYVYYDARGAGFAGPPAK